MPTAIILGLPKGQADRVRGELRTSGRTWHGGWSVHFVPPTGAHSQLREADIRTALNNAAGATESVHVFAITNQGGDRKQEIAAHFSQYFRFRWLPGQWLALPYPTPSQFIDRVDETLADEDEWRQAIQPTDVSSCLLLPASAFATRQADLWDLARRYGEGTTTGCGRRKEEFERAHYKPHTCKSHAKDYFWIDDDQRIFDHTGSQHAVPPPIRQWKYSYRIPSAFHYDVKHANGNKFTVTGASKTETIKSGKYTNIDAHGHFRD